MGTRPRVRRLAAGRPCRAGTVLGGSAPVIPRRPTRDQKAWQRRAGAGSVDERLPHEAGKARRALSSGPATPPLPRLLADSAALCNLFDSCPCQFETLALVWSEAGWILP